MCRLMRHDLIAELCESVTWLDQAGGVDSALPKGTTSGYAKLPGANSNRTLSVYGNVEVKRLVATGPGVHSEVSHHLHVDLDLTFTRCFLYLYQNQHACRCM